MNVYSTTPVWSRAETQLDAVLARFNIPASFSIQAWSPNYFDAMCTLSSVEGWTTPELRPKETLAAWENSWAHPCRCGYEWEIGGFSKGNHRHTDHDLLMRTSGQSRISAAWIGQATY